MLIITWVTKSPKAWLLLIGIVLLCIVIIPYKWWKQEDCTGFHDVHLIPMPKNAKLIRTNSNSNDYTINCDYETLSRNYSQELINRNWTIISGISPKVIHAKKDDFEITIILSKTSRQNESLITIKKH